MRLLLPVLALVLAAGPATGQDEEETIELGEEDFEVLEEGGVEVEQEGGEQPPAGARRFLGRLHPAMTHFGVAWALIALPFALARVRYRGLGRADLLVTAAALAGAGAAALTGWIHAPDVMSRPGIGGLVELHRWTAVAVVALLAVALFLRVVLERKEATLIRVAYLVLVGLAAALVLYVGHLGGEITFGEGFLL